MKSMPFSSSSFTGKEKDPETGFGYFGARYMDHELMTMWLSVDPMADKYPSISPYAYCAWNPVKLVDPDGEEIWKPEILKNGTINYVREQGDDAKTLQKQYSLSFQDASYLYSKMENGKIAGSIVKDRMGSEILRFNFNANYSRGDWNKKAVFHLGFALLYNHLFNYDAPFLLKDYFADMPTETGANCTIPRWNMFGRSFDIHQEEQLYIPSFGGGIIPITFVDCTASGIERIEYKGLSFKENGTYQMRFDKHSSRLSHFPIQKIMINVKPEYEKEVRTSYGD